MSHINLYAKLSSLLPDLKAEVNDFMDFLLSKKDKKQPKKKPQFGCAKGQIKMAPDFDAPLDDFKEYM